MRSYGLLLAAWVTLALAACSDSGDDGGSGASGGSSGAGANGGSGGSAGSAGSTGGSSGSTGGSSGSTGGSSGAAGSGGTPSLDCAPLPASGGTVVDVSPGDAATLHSMVLGAAANTTFLLADGTYPIASTLQLSKSGMTLRSASNDASKVIIDGQYQVNELVQITASDVTVAHVTLTHAVHHPIHATVPGGAVDVKNTLIYGAVITDSGQQFVKVNHLAGQPGYVDDGRVECSVFRMTDAGRPNIESCCGGCYTGGIDAHATWNWVVRNNRFEGIYCENGGLAEHAIHFWKGARGTLVENNVIVDCARGIGFGLDGGEGERVYPDNPHNGEMLAHYDGIIRNNVIWAEVPYFDTGIELHIAKEPHVFHNTVVSADSVTSFFSSIDYRFPETFAVIQNNLTRKISVRDNAQGTVTNNLESTPFSHFVDVGALDFHLAAGAASAIDQGIVVGEAGVDLDGQTHDVGAPDLGADEHSP